MSDEAALLNAIIAHPEEDTPRLAFADYLDEHGNPDRAAFIRAQCAYFSASANQPDYPELYDRSFYNRARAEWWHRANKPDLPPGFAELDGEYPDDDMPRRGFPYRLKGDWDHEEGPAPDYRVDQICAGLKKLVTTTTVRALNLPRVSVDQLARILEAPGAEALTGLTVGPVWDDGDEWARVVASAKSLKRLQHLTLHMPVTSRGAKALAGAKFERLESFDVPGMECTAAACHELTSAKWFQRLIKVEAERVGAAALPALLAALTRMPRLEELVLDLDGVDEGWKALGTRDGFPELGSLIIFDITGTGAVEALARGSFPKLQMLVADRLRPGEFRTLINAPWAEHLQSLTVRNGTLGDRSIAELANVPLAKNLWAVQFGGNPLGARALKLLGDGTKFPNLARLDLDSHPEVERKVTPQEMCRFLTELSLPRLLSLYLDGWPVRTAGARALAANPAGANLIGLSLTSTGLTDAGFDALARSPHLLKLEHFNAINNRLANPAALTKPDALPSLKEVWLTGNRITARTGKRIQRSRNWVMEFADE